MKEVVVYSKNDCRQCKMVKRWLTEQSVPFVEHNIENEPEYREEVINLGYNSVPVVVFSTDEVLDEFSYIPRKLSFPGFAPDKLKQLLDFGIKGD